MMSLGGNAQAWLTGLCGSVSDPYKTFSRFHSRGSAPIGEPAPDPNPSRFENAEFDALVDAMAVLAATDEGFDELADQALAIWLHELPVIPLVQARLLTPFNETYWTNWPTRGEQLHPSRSLVGDRRVDAHQHPARRLTRSAGCGAKQRHTPRHPLASHWAEA